MGYIFNSFEPEYAVYSKPDGSKDIIEINLI